MMSPRCRLCAPGAEKRSGGIVWASYMRMSGLVVPYTPLVFVA